MRYLSLLAVAALFACNQERAKTDTTGYDVISEKTYVVRPAQPAEGDSIEIGFYNKQQEMIALLEKSNFKAKSLTNDSLLFRQSNGQELQIIVPKPSDAAGKFSIIAFDPQKNPLFINLNKGTNQVTQYISAK
ncbi:hypothetical protein MKQ68_22020 [Chitinophaga horti]|uniref:Uncharacterized protein n=1 Tax=Chitinophaga horti TaxID=2920382 RepID=A0ABY6IZG1_9BACT|nr:hypothetical protein [Chitinophaga horti]UYQ92760.1 hypothetical protein MKQ68_22020 [Chitinophaga horti]